MLSTDGIKLKACDRDDLMMLSGLLQDATVLIGDMAHDPESGQFLLVVARYQKTDDGARRRLIGINIDGVTRVSRKGFSPHDHDEVLNLLAMIPKDDGIELVFSGESMIRLECPVIKVYAADLGEGWQTVFSPQHDDNTHRD